MLDISQRFTSVPQVYDLCKHGTSSVTLQHKKEDNTKIQNAIKDVSKGKYITMGDFSHGHITMETSRGEDQHFNF